VGGEIIPLLFRSDSITSYLCKYVFQIMLVVVWWQ